MASIDAVLYDFGGVFTVSPFTAARDAGAELGMDMELAMELCFGPYHEDGDHPWHRLERGEVSLVDARAALVELATARGHDIDPFSLLASLAREDGDRPVVVERARAIRADGFRTALVTNNVAEFGDAWRAMVPVADLFEVVIDSSAAGVRKPDARIFQLALDALGVPAERSVFLDDHPANVAAAGRLGLHGIVVGADRIAAFDELDALLGR
ncbi:MAG: Epoxide hydrolase N-terminal domain-like phosphatase [Acidimicrobiales bacterium]|nr:Epoxide hydrolase N-terminal domain-like phosphatase [Acidimicrobiales bacterium]